MAFIDIFNFKKYFATPSDSQVARYGHVNAVAARVTNHGTYSDSTSGDVVDVNVTTYSGSVYLPNFGIPAGAGNDAPSQGSVTLFGDFIKANSIIIVTPLLFTPDLMVVSQSGASEGSIELTINNYSTVEIESVKFNYLIIN